MVVSNHISFIDPHILTELNFKSPGLRFYWLAGIEPFERPFIRWHMQHAGAFSIDRGLVDSRSISFTQRCLNQGDRPLLLFPEGEATYQPTEIAPFYSGAALMAMQAQHHWRNNPDREVTIYPTTTIYRFLTNPTTRITNDSFRLYHQIHQSLRQLDNNAIVKTLPYLPLYLDRSMPMPTLLRSLVNWVLLWVEQPAIANGYSPQYGNALEQRLADLQQWWYRESMAEHLPDDDTVVPDTYDALMTQKNRLRSILVRKRFSATEPEIDNTLARLQQMLNDEITVKPRDLKAWEIEIMGLNYESDPQPKRIERLMEFLNDMRPYAKAITQASDADKARWERQTEETRRIKLVSLILRDLTLITQESSERQWLIWDGLLTKCELLAFGQFVYRGLKRFDIVIHEPFTVSEFVAQHPEATRRELIALMTDHLRTVIAEPLSTLLQQTESNAGGITSAAFKESVLTR